MEKSAIKQFVIVGKDEFGHFFNVRDKLEKPVGWDLIFYLEGDLDHLDDLIERTKIEAQKREIAHIAHLY